MFGSTRRKGFTLLELIVAIVVLGILSTLAVPAFASVKTKMAENVVTRNADGVIRDARALASFDSASLNNTYLDAAGAESTGYVAAANAVTVTSGSKTIVATINDTTGEITLSTTAGAVVVATEVVHHTKDCRYQWGCGWPSGEGIFNVNRTIITTMGDVYTYDTLETTYSCPNGGTPDANKVWCEL